MPNDRLTRQRALEAYNADGTALQGDDLPEKVKDCAESVKEDNPDLTKSQAIAICRDQLDMATDDNCPDGQVRVAGECQAIEEVADVPPSVLNMGEDAAIYRLAAMDTEPIERIEAGENTVRYENVKLISPGVWTDSASRETVWYSPEGMKNLEVAEDNAVNIMHDEGNEVSEAGHIDPDSIHNTEEGVFGDIVIDTSGSAGQYADENLQETLESEGAKGFGGPSVEIAPEGQEIEFNESKGMRELVGGIISGLGLVKNPAAKSVSFARQTAQRGVALSGGDEPTTMFLRDESGDMPDADTRAQVLAAIDDDITLEGAMDAIRDDAQAIADELDVPIGEVMEVLDPLLDIDEEDEGEEGEEMADDEEEDNEADAEEEDEDEEEEEEMDMEEIAQRVDALDERLTNVEDMVESAMAAEDVEETLSEELEEAASDLADAETVAELEEAAEELEARLSDLESEPDRDRALADGEGEEEEIDGHISMAGERDSQRGTISR